MKHIVLCAATMTAALLIAATLASCERRPPAVAPMARTHTVLMGTEVNLIAVAPDLDTARKASDAAVARMAQLEQLMSRRISGSDVARCNQSAGSRPVSVSVETFTVLQQSLAFARASGGAFDITVLPLIDAWRSAAAQQRLPTDAEMKQARALVGYDKVFLDATSHTVRFSGPGVEIDLGGIAKGYIVDQGIEAMRNAGATAALIDAGGDIASFGERASGGPWHVGVQDPRRPDAPATIDVLALKDMAACTSGDYRRYVTIKGRHFSHIIDPRAGWPVDVLPSVTIIARNATVADALATAVSVLGLDDGMKLIETQQGVEGLLLTIEDGRIVRHESPGFARFRVEPETVDSDAAQNTSTPPPPAPFDKRNAP